MNNLTVTGIDLGSSSVKIAAVLKGGVQVITNQANFRQTPNVLGFFQSERLIGQEGQVKIKTNHSNTVVAPSRYLGFNKESQSKYLEQQLKFCPCRSTYNNPSLQTLKFIISSQKDSFYPEQLVASYINEIQKIISKTNSLQNKHMTIAVPSYFTQNQRKALLNSIEISNKKLNKCYQIDLIDEQIAISMDYGFSRRNQFQEDWQKSKNVLFIDFGHSKTNIFLTAFNKNHMRVLANRFNRQLGCKFMDNQLLQFYAKKFDQTHQCLDLNILQSKKATLKLLDAIQRQRKTLSGISEHELNIECLLQEEDFNYTMKRDQYQKVCDSTITKFKQILLDIAQQLRQKSISFDLIQLIGGGTRIPIILKIVNQVFNIEPSRTINSSECIAKGAALVSAINSSIFKIYPYAYFNVNSYPINLKINGNTIGKELVQKNQLIIKQKILNFQLNIINDNQTIIIQVQYDQGVIQKGLNRLIFKSEVNLRKRKPSLIQQKNQNKIQEQQLQSYQNIVKLQLTIKIDQNGLYIFDSLNTQRKNIIVKMSKLNTFEKFTPAQLCEMQQKQKQMAQKDVQIKKFYQKKNQFEGFIYKSRQKLQNFVVQNKQYASQVQFKQIINHLNQQQQKLYEQNQQISLINKCQQFFKKTQLIKQKIDKLFVQVNKIKQIHIKVNNQLTKLTNYINQIINKRGPNNYPQQFNKAGQWINSMIQKQKLEPKYKMPIVKVQQIQNVFQNLSQNISAFDNQMQRQRMHSQRGQRVPHQQYQRHPVSSYYHSQEEPNYSNQNPYRSTYQQGLYEPRPTRNTRNKNTSNPFGSGFFGKGPSFF